MFEKPRLFTKDSTIHIYVAADAAPHLVSDLQAEGFDAVASADNLTFTDFNSGIEESVAVVDVTSGSKDDVRVFLRKRGS